jgi:hypothetical protein
MENTHAYKYCYWSKTSIIIRCKRFMGNSSYFGISLVRKESISFDDDVMCTANTKRLNLIVVS